MGLRDNLQGTATRLVAKFGDPVQMIVMTSTAGATEFDAPTLTPTETTVEAVVTGANKWKDGETILMGDLAVMVSGAYPVFDIGARVKIDGKQYTIVMRRDILASGVKSAVRYVVRG